MDLQDKLIASQEAQIKALNERLETEKRISAVQAELAESRRREADSLRAALDSAQKTIAIKDEILANKDEEIKILKKKRKPSIGSILKAVGVGVGIGLLL